MKQGLVCKFKKNNKKKKVEMVLIWLRRSKMLENIEEAFWYSTIIQVLLYDFLCSTMSEQWTRPESRYGGEGRKKINQKSVFLALWTEWLAAPPAAKLVSTWESRSCLCWHHYPCTINQSEGTNSPLPGLCWREAGDGDGGGDSSAAATQQRRATSHSHTVLRSTSLGLLL